MRLLLIEDEKALSDAIRKLLEQARYTVDTAYDGEEGLLLAFGGSYDAIILDVMLPKWTASPFCAVCVGSRMQRLC